MPFPFINNKNAIIFFMLSIRKKFALGFIVFIGGILLLTGVAYHFFIKDEVLGIEKNYVKEDLLLLNKYIDLEQENLLSITKDWAAWTDAWLFIQGKNPTFAKNNITAEAFVNNNLSLMAYFDIKGNLVCGYEYDYKSKALTNIDKNFWMPYLEKAIAAGKNAKPINSPSGFTFRKGKPLLVASYPVLKSDYSGELAGYLLTARHLSNEKIDSIEKLLGLSNLKIREQDRGNIDGLEDIKVSEEDGVFKITIIKEDFFNQKNIVIEAKKNKKLWSLVQSNVKKIIFLYLSCFIILGFLFYCWINRNIILRIGKIVREINDVKTGIIDEISSDGNDEIGKLSSEINGYIQTIKRNLREIEGSRKIYETIAEKSEAIIMLFNIKEELIFTNTKAKEIMKDENLSKNLLSHLKEIVTINEGEKTFLSDFRLSLDFYISAWIIPVGEDKFLFMAHDISSIKKEKEKLFELASKDSLTSLYNRTYFEASLRKILNSNGQQEQYYLVFIDLDNLKDINDRFGHISGDASIKAVAKSIIKSIGEMDLAARWGGDEFVVIVKGGENRATYVAESIQKNLNNTENEFLHEFKPTVSIGITKIEKSRNLESIVREADKSAYDAKRDLTEKIKIFRND